MKLNLFSKLALSALLLTGVGQVRSQCTFTGLGPSYCPNSPSVQLTPGITGGVWTGPVANSAFVPSLAVAGTNTVTYSYCDANYTVQQGVYAPLAVSGTSLSSSDFNGSWDDGTTNALPIGFTFRFFCTDYTDFYACTNGFITFTGGQSSPYLANPFPTNGTTPVNVIAAAWTDLNLNLAPTGGSVTYTTVGTAPNRQLVVTYSAVPHHNVGQGGYPVTTQIILYETTNIIEIHTTSMPNPVNSQGTIYNATEGIQDATGTNFAVVPGRNGVSTWSVTNDMYQFIPGLNCSTSQTVHVSSPNVPVAGSSSICTGATTTLTASDADTYTWTTSAGTFTTSTISVNPTTNTQYSVASTNSDNCVANSVITVTVDQTATISLTASNSGSICLGNSVTINATGATAYTLSTGLANGAAFNPTATATYTVSGENACGTQSNVITVTVTPLPIFSVLSSSLVCENTAATVTPGGGSSYTIMPGTVTGTGSVTVIPVTNTTYTIFAESGVCVGTSTFVLNTKPNPTVTIAANNATVCPGDAITLTASGADTYVWSLNNQVGASITDNPTSTTIYNVVGTNSLSCTGDASQLVFVKSAPNVSVSVSSSVICAGTSATLTAHGAPSYAWSNNTTTSVNVVSPAQSITYSVTGTGTNGCSSMPVPVDVTVLSSTIGVISTPTAVCPGSPANLVASGADSYTWSPLNSNAASISVSPTQNTIYTVNGSVNDLNSGLSCNVSNTVAVAVYVNPVVTAVADRSVICIGETALLTGAGAGATGTYTWTGGSGVVVTATNAVSPIADQSFTVTGADDNGCKGKGTVLVQVAQCTGIASISANNMQLSIYPNPSNGEFTISTDQNITLQITNELGQQVKTVILNNSNREAKINSLSNGIYFITGKNENGSVKQKIIIAK